MLRKILLLIIMCVTTLSVSSCTVTSVEYHVELTCDQFAGNAKYIYTSEIAMEVGDKIVLELCSNQTTGFKWDYEMTTEDIVDEIDYKYIAPEEGVVGAPGMESWTFKAVQKGTTQIKMEYSQPWEGGTKAEHTYTLTVTVESVE
jgi:inhibitor of cysteine peptidase